MATLYKIATIAVDRARALLRPKSGRVYDYSPLLDSGRGARLRFRGFQQLNSLIQRGESGLDAASALGLLESLERADPRLHSLAQTRRLAVTGLDWQIESAAEAMPGKVDKGLADETASFVRESLKRLLCFDCCLEHLSYAIGRNLTVLELVWDQALLADIVPIPTWRLNTLPHEANGIFVLTEDDLSHGVPAVPPQFVVHIPHNRSGTFFSDSLTLAVAMISYGKRLASIDWMAYAEIFGMPVRYATYRPGASSDERAQLIDMMKNMGSNAWAVFSESCQVQLMESQARGDSPYEALCNYFDRQMSIAFLGGNLTSDTTGGTGTYSAASVQDQVREDLRDDDMKREARTIREQIIRPMVELAFPGRDAPVPFFKRIKPETVNRIEESQLMANAQRIGMAVPEDWARQRLGIPKPNKKDAILKPPDAFEDALTEDQRWNLSPPAAGEE